MEEEAPGRPRRLNKLFQAVNLQTPEQSKVVQRNLYSHMLQ